ncbi:hypothetical protein AB0D10_37655 [Kitasatospora sp. NPDC048545]|uniref:hypothetical protein n=1 Tax=Kitasatospora sp. NPDC048545 TaxID=3157208 RepID=UPI0033ED5944
MSWKKAVQAGLRVLLQQDEHADPHLALLRLGAESPEIDAKDVTITLVMDVALVTGTLVSTETWEHLHLDQLRDHDWDLRRMVKEAIGHLDETAEDGRRRREVDRRFLHLRDVTYRTGRAVHVLPL